MTDQMVLETQKWLNKTYGKRPSFGSVSETGATGWGTIYGLIRALQLELGISQTVNNFGPRTEARFKVRWPQGIKQQRGDDSSSSNVYAIIQGALWCKGYSTGAHITPHFHDGTGLAIRQLKSDMGLGGDSTVTLDIMKSLLSMDQYVLLSHWGGKAMIRGIQQAVNSRYRKYTGIIPTDGVYGRAVNMAMIQVLQAIEGFTPEQATGTFGNGTRSRLMILDAANSASHPEWTWIASAMLVFNGYLNSATEFWTTNSPMTAALGNFQQDYHLPRTGKFDRTTWMSLFTSKGDPGRPCTACDTRFEVTAELLRNLKADGYRIVGRYLSEPGQESKSPQNYFKAIRPGELKRIVDGGMEYFPIYQENSTDLSDFSAAAGALHARRARAAAQRLGVPPTVIYFAVDFDATDPQVTSNIMPYFKAIKQTLGGGYSIGIYASRNICSRVIEAGYAVTAFVSDMSTGFSGNLGFTIPREWNFDQFTEIDGYRGKWDLDRVAYSGRYPACSTVVDSAAQIPIHESNPPSAQSDPFFRWTAKTEKECVAKVDPAFRDGLGEFILDWLRKPEYWSESVGSGSLWHVFTPEPSSPKELVMARSTCAVVCAQQPQIKGTLPGRDVAHMAATTLGYLIWGIPDQSAGYPTGDLGGWAVDLLQFWGSYEREKSSQNLAEWSMRHLGSKTDGKGFDFSDVLADADAYLIARAMTATGSSRSLTDAMREVFSLSPVHRIRRFYDTRFGGSVEAVMSSFARLIGGVFTGAPSFLRIDEVALKRAAHADRMPTKKEADTLARAFAAYAQEPVNR